MLTSTHPLLDPPMPPRKPLSSVSSGAFSPVEDAHGALRDGIVAIARELQAEGCTPEQMIVRVRMLIIEATPPELDRVAARAFMEDAVRACIEGYYSR